MEKKEIEIFWKRMKCKVFFYYLRNEHITTDNYGFSTKKCPPQIEELSNLEKEILNLNLINDINLKKKTWNLNSKTNNGKM